jgi:hypothetical protein
MSVTLAILLRLWTSGTRATDFGLDVLVISLVERKEQP